MSDSEPIVLDPEDPAFSDQPEPADVLTTIMARSMVALATAASAQDYLRNVGLTVPNVWDAFRLGAGHPTLTDGLDASDWAALDGLGLVHGLHRTLTLAKPGGLNLPTFDPREPERVVGVIRMVPCQHKHHFATPPVGLACTSSIATEPRIVLVDAPLLGMRLAQVGVTGVAIVEDPAALVPPLRDWLGQRELVIAGGKQRSVEAIAIALGEAGERATRLVLVGDHSRYAAASLVALGLAPAELPEVTPHLLRDLHAYAVNRLSAGEATEALQMLEIDQAELVSTYRIGYLPDAYREALPKADRLALQGKRLTRSIVLPAFDEHGAVVDLLALQVREQYGTYIGLAPEPRGLLAPEVATAHQDIIVVDSIHTLGLLAAAGHRNVLLLRGPEDARANARRLHAAGVRAAEVRVRRFSGDFASALASVGIAVSEAPCPHDRRDDGHSEAQPITQAAATIEPTEPVPATSAEPIPFPIGMVQPAPGPDPAAPVPVVVPQAPPTSVTIEIPPLVLAEHDRQGERATFTAGPTTYVVQIPWDRDTQQEVVIRHAGKVFIDQLQLASAAARQRAAGNAALRCGLPALLIDAHLLALREAVLALLDAGNSASDAPLALAPTGADYDEAMGLLRSPDVFDRLVADLEALGWIGEDAAKRLFLLAAISRKLPEPVWLALSTSQGASTSALAILAEVTPPEDVIQASRFTGHALYYQDEHALRHKLLVIDNADTLPAEVVVALGILQQRGALSAQQVPRHNLSGSARTQTHEIRGPVAVVTTTAGALPERLASACCLVAADESPQHTQRVLAAQRRMAAQPGMGLSEPARAAIRRRHHHLARLLASRPVAIPYADRIAFPALTIQHRRDQRHLLGLISASALLHQHQRLSDRGHVVADERDFHLALALAGAAGIGADTSMGRNARLLLDALTQAQASTFSLNDCQRLLPQWGRTMFRSAITELMRLDYLASTRGGRGRAHDYTLLSAYGGTAPSAIRLLPVGQMVALGFSEKTNFSSDVATG